MAIAPYCSPSPALLIGTDRASVSGFVFASGRYYHGDEVVSYFAQAQQWTDFVRLASEASGEWRIVLPHRDELWIAIDRAGSQRLFYTESTPTRLAESGYALLDGMERLSWDEEACLMFLRWGFAHEHHTLIEGISRLPAGHCLRITKRQILLEPHYHRVEHHQGDLTGHIEGAAERLVAHLNGRLAVIPLTGGYDSRMIAYQLRRLGYRNILALGYGQPGNADAVQGQEIARRLGIEYHFEPSIQRERPSYVDDTSFTPYLHYMTGLASGYYYQEYLPSEALARLAPDAVVLPGHQGDDLGGSQLIDIKLASSRADVAHALVGHMQQHQRFTSRQRQRLLDLHRRLLSRYPSELAPHELLEHFMRSERIPKYNLNSQASWRYRGLATAGLFLDRELASYAYNLPWQARYGKQHYEQEVRRLYTEAGLMLESDRTLIKLLRSPAYRLRQSLKPFLGPLLMKYRDLFSGDLIGLAHVMQPVRERVIQDGRFRPTSINGLSFCWYLMHLEQELGLPLPTDLYHL